MAHETIKIHIPEYHLASEINSVEVRAKSQVEWLYINYFPQSEDPYQGVVFPPHCKISTSAIVVTCCERDIQIWTPKISKAVLNPRHDFTIIVEDLESIWVEQSEDRLEVLSLDTCLERGYTPLENGVLL